MTSFLRRITRGSPVIVVSGLPRSGTSMAMRMLHAGGLPILTDSVRQPDESNPHGYYEFDAVKTLGRATSADWLADARGKAVKIVSPLLTHLPERYDYRVVFLRRNLDEILASQNAMLAAREMPRGAEDERMRAYYQEHLAQVERFLARRACFTSMTVHYAEVVTNPRAQASRINDFVSGRLDEARMARAVEATLYRQRFAAGR